MAILPGFPGLEVDVVAGGLPLHEYNHPTNPTGTTTDSSAIKYIEATPGIEFAIRIRTDDNIKNLDHDLHYEVEVDGVYKLGFLLMRSNRAVAYTDTVDGIPSSLEGQTIMRKFVFVTLVTGILVADNEIYIPQNN